MNECSLSIAGITSNDNEFVFKKNFYVCPVKKELHLLNEEKLMNIINSQKELYNKMVKFVKQIMVDEKINDLEKDFDNVKFHSWPRNV